jgi:TnpA family transposase
LSKINGYLTQTNKGWTVGYVAACKIYKELERQLKEKKTRQSPEQVIDILKTILMVRFTTPYSQKIYEELILNTAEQKELASHFNLHL